MSFIDKIGHDIKKGAEKGGEAAFDVVVIGAAIVSGQQGAIVEEPFGEISHSDRDRGENHPPSVAPKTPDAPALPSKV
jgi:hypothetical protein